MLSLRNIFKRFNVPYTKQLRKKSTLKDNDINRTRNIGILAHIDAGKTTSTERMLYYSGSINQMGEVHHGNTVTDYMEQERERGITITSAAVTFTWKQHHFNLIDTPGHIDFTMEVEQTLNVLDGAVVILDGSAGVEAQTITVWRQADNYQIPRLIFVNKMDRSDAVLEMSCNSIEKKLNVPSLCLQIPIHENQKLLGLVDILSLEKLIWNTTQKDKDFHRTSLTEKDDLELWTEAKEKREKLIDKISEFNDDLANHIITLESLDEVKTTDVVKALRAITLERKAVLVFCGSAYKNIGVQPLMDGIINYLPSPVERNQHFSVFEDDLCARAFKVRHDKQRGGPLVFFRIYSGSFKKGQKIFNIQQDKTEQTGKLYVAYADDVEEVESITNGNIAVVAGLKETVTGDLITSSSSAAQKAKKKMLNLSSTKKKDSHIEDTSIEALFGIGAKIPEPVFFCSIEPPSLAYQSSLEQALIELQREDPSLRVNHDEETSQTVLAGMGELHLEIIKDRIIKEYKIQVELGPLQIAYREAPITKITDEKKIETKIGKSNQSVVIRLSIIPMSNEEKEIMVLDKSQEASSNIAHIFHKHLIAVKQGIKVGLLHGPKINSQVVKTQVMLHMLEVGRGTSETIIAATTTQLVQKLLQKSGTYILAPVMKLEIVTPRESISAITADLSRRGAEIQEIDFRGSYKVIHAHALLSELLGYSTDLRTISSGTASYSLEFLEYQKLTSEEEAKAIQRIQGF